MEREAATATAEPGRPATADLLPGLLVTAAGVTAAVLLSFVVPALGALSGAVVLGVVAGHLPGVPASVAVGIGWATRHLLRAGVVLLGLQLAVPQILRLGGGTILAVVLTVAIGFLGTLGLGRLLRVPRGLRLLIATGFSICGASAIAAMEGVVRRRDADVATAIALVTLYGSLAIVAMPLFGPLLGMTGPDLGTWVGLSVHEVAQVVAAASPAGAAAMTAATVVKLSRVVLLAPMVAAVSVVERRGPATDSGRRPPLVPLFVLGFVAMVGLRTTGLLPPAALDVAGTLTTLLLAGALFGLGYAVRLRALLHTGPRALVLGLLSTVLVASVGLAALRSLA